MYGKVLISAKFGVCSANSISLNNQVEKVNFNDVILINETV